MLATDSTLYRETTATVHPVPRAADGHPGATPRSTSRSRSSDEQAPGGAGGERGRDRVPAGAGWRRPLPAHPGFLRQLGLSQGPPRGRRVAGRGGAAGDRARRPASSSLVLQGPIRVIDWHFRFRGRHIHKYCHFFLFESPDGEPARRRDEGITACQWRPLEEALETLSYDNARGVLKRAGEMVRTLVAIGAGRSRPRTAAAARARRADAWPPSPRCSRAGPPCSRCAARCRQSGARASSPAATPAALRRVLERRLVDAVVLCPEPRRSPTSPSSGRAARRSRSWPTRRSGPTTASCSSPAGATRWRRVAVEGVDDPIVGDMVMRALDHRGAPPRAGRRAAHAPAHRAAPAGRLGRAVGEVERPVRTTDPRQAAQGEPGAPLPPVRRGRRAQSQAGDRPRPASPAPPSCSPTPASPSPPSCGCSTSPPPAT